MFGNSEKLKLGTPFYLLSHIAALTDTVTKGILSAKNRRTFEIGTWLQIDAESFYGSGGGLALGIDGKIYGMTAAIMTTESCSFAIPSDEILRALDQLMAGSNSAHPWLGMLLEPMPKTGDQTKVYVRDIFPLTELLGKSIKPGDCIQSINQVEIKNNRHAQELINRLDVDGFCRIQFLETAKDNHCEEILTVLSRRPIDAIYYAYKNGHYEQSLLPLFGFNLHSEWVRISNDRSYLSITASLVKKDSISWDLGIRPGEHITILRNEYIGKKRYVSLLHIPGDPFQNMTQELWNKCYLDLEIGEHHEDIF